MPLWHVVFKIHLVKQETMNTVKNEQLLAAFPLLRN